VRSAALIAAEIIGALFAVPGTIAAIFFGLALRRIAPGGQSVLRLCRPLIPHWFGRGHAWPLN